MDQHTTEATDRTRAPHRATRALVEEDGVPQARALYDLFEVYNRRFFGGRLQQALILILEPSSRRALADYCAKDEQGLQSRIRLPRRVVISEKYGPNLGPDALLHEMVHAWQHEIESDGEPGYRGHGPKFAAKCNEIGKVLGLPEVSEKGRHGLKDCAYWPTNVRPPGYYVTDWIAPTRAKKEKAEPAAASSAGEGESEGGEDVGSSSWAKVRALVSTLEPEQIEELRDLCDSLIGGDA